MNEEKASSNATVALVLGIVGFFFSLASPFAIWLGMRELKDIREGRSSPAGQGFAMAGLILGIIGTCFLLIGCVCGGAYILFILGIISGIPLMASLTPTFVATDVRAEMMRIHHAQQTFYERDLDHDGVKDYAATLDELARCHAFDDGHGKPSVAGYVFEVEGGEHGFTTRAVPVRKGYTQRFFIDESGVLRATADGSDPGPKSPPDDGEKIPAEKDDDDESGD